MDQTYENSSVVLVVSTKQTKIVQYGPNIWKLFSSASSINQTNKNSSVMIDGLKCSKVCSVRRYAVLEGMQCNSVQCSAELNCYCQTNDYKWSVMPG